MPRLPRRARRPRVQPGAAPGTVQRPQSESPVEMRVIVYDGERFIDERVHDLQRAFELHEEPGITWIDVVSPDVTTLNALGARFELHPLTLEDIADGRQRSKLEAYRDHLFIVVRAVRPDPDVLFRNHQVALFVGKGFVISVRDERHGQFEPVRERLQVARGRIRERGADYLGYALLDSVVDHYLPVVDVVTEQIETLADDLLGPSTESLVAQVQDARRALGRLRRLSMPLKDVVESMHREPVVLADETRLFLRDCIDNAVTILDSVEQLREMATHVMDAHMALVNHRMNEVMKVLTVMSAVFIPLSFIAGLYGMNFDGGVSPYNMPELRWTYGYPFALSLMTLLAGTLVFYFYRRGWLGRSAAADVTPIAARDDKP